MRDQKICMAVGADDESLKVHLAVQEKIAEEKAKSGNVLSYLDGLRRVELARGKRNREQDQDDLCSCGAPAHRVALVEQPELEGADPESVKLHLAAEAEIEQAKRQGETISYFAAVQRASARLGQ